MPRSPLRRERRSGERRSAGEPRLPARLHRGVFFATVALKGRLAKLDPPCREAVREVGRYQTMIKGFADALEETIELHRQRGSAPA